MKSLAKNSIYNIIYKFFMIGFPLVSSIYVSRVLMPSGVGKVAYAQNVVSYFVAFSGLGVSTYGVREIGKIQQDKKKYSKVFAELFLIVFTTTLFCSFVYYFCIIAFNPFGNKLLYAVAGLQLLLGAFNVDWFYQGIEEYRYITSRSIVMKLLSLLFMFLSVRNKEDIIPYALMSSIALAGNNIVNIIHIRKYIDFYKLNKLNFKRHIYPLIVLFSTTIAVELYTKLDITMLGILSADVHVGYYNYATRITTIVVTLATSVSTVLLPRFSYYKENGKIEELNDTIKFVHKGILTITIPAAIGLSIFARDIICFLFGESFEPASMTVRILAVLIVIKSIGNLYGTQILVSFGAEKFLFFSTLFGAVSNVIMNAFLIPMFEESGAAIASVISELIVCMVQIFLSKRFVDVKVGKWFYLQLGFSSCLMAMIVIGICHQINSLILRMIVGIPTGIVVFYLFGLLLKNDVIETIQQKFWEIIKQKRNENGF